MDLQDVRRALHRLRSTPGFTTVALLSLGLGIGANAAIFTVVSSALFRRLPVADPESLVEVYTSEGSGFRYSTTSYPDFQDLREPAEVFTHVVATETVVARVDASGKPSAAFGEIVSWDYFQALGVPVALGRCFLPEEDRSPGAPPGGDPRPPRMDP